MDLDKFIKTEKAQIAIEDGDYLMLIKLLADAGCEAYGELGLNDLSDMCCDIFCMFEEKD